MTAVGVVADSPLVGHRVRFKAPRGIRTGVVESHYAWDVPSYHDEHGKLVDPGGVTGFVKIREANGVIERRADDVLAVCDIRPKNWRRR